MIDQLFILKMYVKMLKTNKFRMNVWDFGKKYRVAFKAKYNMENHFEARN